MKTKIAGSPHHHLTYVPAGWQRGMAMVALLYPECEIQISKPDAKAGTVTSTIKGAREGDTVRSRISAFIDIARKEKAAVMLVCDTETEAGTMVKLMRQAMPELRRIETQEFLRSREFGRGLRKAIEEPSMNHLLSLSAMRGGPPSEARWLDQRNERQRSNVSKLKWTAGPWGMDRGEQTLGMDRVTARKDGFYTAVKQIAGSDWEGTDGAQFIRAWREQMRLNGLDIDEETFLRTVRQIAHDKARRFAYAVMQDVIDPVAEGQRVFESSSTYRHHTQIKRAVRNLLTPRKCHKNHTEVTI